MERSVETIDRSKILFNRQDPVAYCRFCDTTFDIEDGAELQLQAKYLARHGKPLNIQRYQCPICCNSIRAELKSEKTIYSDPQNYFDVLSIVMDNDEISNYDNPCRAFTQRCQSLAFPYEVFLKIFEYLNLASLLKVIYVCKKFGRIGSDVLYRKYSECQYCGCKKVFLGYSECIKCEGKGNTYRNYIPDEQDSGFEDCDACDEPLMKGKLRHCRNCGMGSYITTQYDRKCNNQPITDYNYDNYERFMKRCEDCNGCRKPPARRDLEW